MSPENGPAANDTVIGLDSEARATWWTLLSVRRLAADRQDLVTWIPAYQRTQHAAISTFGGGIAVGVETTVVVFMDVDEGITRYPHEVSGLITDLVEFGQGLAVIHDAGVDWIGWDGQVVSREGRGDGDWFRSGDALLFQGGRS